MPSVFKDVCGISDNRNEQNDNERCERQIDKQFAVHYKIEFNRNRLLRERYMNRHYSRSVVSSSVVSRSVASGNVTLGSASTMISKAVSTLFIFGLLVGAVALGGASNVQAQTAEFQISGDGVIGKDSVKVGEDFSLDLYLSNAGPVSGFTLGFELKGKNGLKSVTHLWPKGDEDPASNITAHGGFDSTIFWDFGKLMKPVFSWDGKLPDSVLIGGVSMNKGWPKTEKPEHYVSIEMRANQPGSICIDSAYIPPSGAWLFSPKPSPSWAGEYCITAVGGNPCAGKTEAKGK